MRNVKALKNVVRGFCPEMGEDARSNRHLVPQDPEGLHYGVWR